jgi:hypothetical protein
VTLLHGTKHPHRAGDAVVPGIVAGCAASESGEPIPRRVNSGRKLTPWLRSRFQSSTQHVTDDGNGTRPSQRTAASATSATLVSVSAAQV